MCTIHIFQFSLNQPLEICRRGYEATGNLCIYYISLINHVHFYYHFKHRQIFLNDTSMFHIFKCKYLWLLLNVPFENYLFLSNIFVICKIHFNESNHWKLDSYTSLYLDILSTFLLSFFSKDFYQNCLNNKLYYFIFIEYFLFVRYISMSQVIGNLLESFER